MNQRGALANFLVSAGFTLIRSNKHQIWGCPCGHGRVTVSNSRHGGRGDNNARAEIARTLRACKPRQENAA
jgi:hypothetical protein